MFVALEGIDGAGKNTLTEGLVARAAAAGLSCATLSFPRYQETAFGQLVGRYLNGEFGDLNEVSPDFAALLYAGDRYESLGVIEAALRDNDMVIADRYVASSAAYQAARLATAARQAFIDRVADIEHAVFRLPVPDLYVLLDVPPAKAADMVLMKAKRSYTDKAADLHEANHSYLATCDAIYREIARKGFGAPWVTVSVLDAAGGLRPPDEIASDAWSEIERRLPKSGAG